MNLSIACGRVFWILFTLVLSFTTVSEGWAKVYLTPEQALELAFPNADRIETQTLRIDAKLKTDIQKRIKTLVRFSKMDVHIGMNEGKPMGYAMIHNVKGRVRPITFMVVIGTGGKIQRVEILAYRESHGGEIRYPSFLKQFAGKGILDPIRNKRDIRNISGATISCRSIADGVRVLLSLWEEVYPAGKIQAPEAEKEREDGMHERFSEPSHLTNGIEGEAVEVTQ